MRSFFYKIRKDLIIIFLFSISTLIFTFPIILNIDNKITDQGDPFFVSWVIQSSLDTIKSGNFSDFWNQNIFYPYPNTMAFSDHSLTLTLQALPISFFNDNNVFLVNYTQIISFFLSALFSYYLIYFYTKNKIASFIGAVIFGFSPYHIGQISHIQIASYQYIPLTILFFEKLLKDKKLSSAIIFGLAFLLNAFVSIYLLCFILIPLIIIFILRLVDKTVFPVRQTLIKLTISCLIILPPLFAMYLPYLDISKDFNIIRDKDEVVLHSADIEDYIISPSNHIYWGRVSQQIFESRPAWFWSEHQLFFGFITITLAFTTIATIFKKNKNFIKNNSTKIIYAIIVISSIIFSFGPVVKIGGLTITLPFNFLYEYVFFFQATRVPTRISILTLMGLSVLVALLIDNIYKNFHKYKLARAGLVIIATLIFIEQLSIPINVHTPRDINYAFYNWTKENIPTQEVFVHYPFYRDIEYLRSSSIDRRRMFNGYSGFFPESTRRIMDSSMFKEFFYNPKLNLEILSSLGINYFVLHTQLAKESIGENNYEILSQSISNLLKDKKIELVLKEASEELYYIKKLANKDYYKTQTEIHLFHDNNYIYLFHENQTNTTWVSENLDKYKIKVEYFQDEIKIDEKYIEFYKTLFLKSGEAFETKVKIPRVYLKQYNNIKFNILN